MQHLAHVSLHTGLEKIILPTTQWYNGNSRFDYVENQEMYMASYIIIDLDFDRTKAYIMIT